MPLGIQAARHLIEGMETMKKIAISAAVLTLGLAACQDNAPDNAASTVNTIETEAASDTNSTLDATDNLSASAGNAVDAVGSTASNVGNSVSNAADASGNAAADVANGQDNVAGR